MIAKMLHVNHHEMKLHIGAQYVNRHLHQRKRLKAHTVS